MTNGLRVIRIFLLNLPIASVRSVRSVQNLSIRSVVRVVGSLRDTREEGMVRNLRLRFRDDVDVDDDVAFEVRQTI